MAKDGSINAKIQSDLVDIDTWPQHSAGSVAWKILSLKQPNILLAAE